MNKDSNKTVGRILKTYGVLFAVFMILVIVKYPPWGKSSTDSSAKNRYENYEPGTNYRYYSGSKSYSSSSSKSSSGSKTYGSSNKSSSKSSSSGTAKRYTSRQKSAKEQAYDDFMEDALESYLDCVDDMDEYWDAIEYFDEDWLTPDEKEELDRLMKSFDE